MVEETDDSEEGEESETESEEESEYEEVYETDDDEWGGANSASATRLIWLLDIPSEIIQHLQIYFYKYLL